MPCAMNSAIFSVNTSASAADSRNGRAAGGTAPGSKWISCFTGACGTPFGNSGGNTSTNSSRTLRTAALCSSVLDFAMQSAAVLPASCAADTAQTQIACISTESLAVISLRILAAPSVAMRTLPGAGTVGTPLSTPSLLCAGGTPINTASPIITLPTAQSITGLCARNHGMPRMMSTPGNNFGQTRNVTIPVHSPMVMRVRTCCVLMACSPFAKVNLIATRAFTTFALRSFTHCVLTTSAPDPESNSTAAFPSGNDASACSHSEFPPRPSNSATDKGTVT